MKIKENLSIISIFLAGVILCWKLLKEYEFCLFYLEVFVNSGLSSIALPFRNDRTPFFLLLLLIPISLSVLAYWKGNRFARISLAFNAVALILVFFPVVFMLFDFVKR